MAHAPRAAFLCVFLKKKKEHIDDIREPISGPTL
jgi:hypothetical protein